MNKETSIAWLMAGDPAVRWQTMRDLLGAPEVEWRAERNRMREEGWGAKFLAALESGGNWPESRWTGNVWSLVILIELGFPAEHQRVRSAAHSFMQLHLTEERAGNPRWLMEQMDQCHLGFWLRIGSYFGFDPTRLMLVAEALLRVQFEDGGWNCRIRTAPNTIHSSFHTTLNVVEGLREAAAAEIIEPDGFRASEQRAGEFMLQHRLYRSDKTGAVISPRFLELSYPSTWHYTILRGLDYLRLTPEIMDSRLDDPISVVVDHRKANGRWPVEKRIPGDWLFHLETGESRWNTLRALRVLEARGG